MVDDALKNTRNIHRLLLTVAFITIVFSLSISFPKDKQHQLDKLNELTSIEFLAYDEFISHLVKEFEQTQLLPLANKLKAKLEEKDYPILQLHHIHEIFEKNIHTGSLLTKELILSNIHDATLNQFEYLNTYSLDKDIQVLVPDIEEVAKALVSFFDNTDVLGTRVDDLLLTLGQELLVAESFLPMDEVLVSLYFVLPVTITPAAAPVFTTDFPATVISIPNSSFLYWLSKFSAASQVVHINQDSLTWLPDVTNRPDGFNEQKIGLLKDRLTNEIKSSSPEQQKISLLGANIPGLLFIYASPVILLSLSYYLMNSTSHLSRLSSTQENLILFEQFSWPPLALQKNWLLDFLTTILLLPNISLIVLFYQLRKFGPVEKLPLTVLIMTMVCMLLIHIRSYNNISTIRGNIKLNKFLNDC